MKKNHVVLVNYVFSLINCVNGNLKYLTRTKTIETSGWLLQTLALDVVTNYT